MPYMFWQGKDSPVYPLYRLSGKQDRLPGEQGEDDQILITRTSLCGGIRQQRTAIAQTAMADEVWIWHQGDS